MSLTYTLKDVADFCYANRRRKAFKNWSYDEVACEVVLFAQKDRLLHVYDNQGICGVCLYSLRFVSRVIFIHHIVAVRSGFKTMCKHAVETHPGFQIQGQRNTKIVTFRHLWEATCQA